MMVFTAMFESGSYVDSLSFLGVHQTAVSESLMAFMCGTRKYVNAKGYAIVKRLKTLPSANQTVNDGVETLQVLSVEHLKQTQLIFLHALQSWMFDQELSCTLHMFLNARFVSSIEALLS
ncbi:hypothetical protein NE237_022495 [Protea cynaroides]|uniref:Uncharacterized protein n=1 Tax=Protea cynaroides TaxID=273540 RepID=A0A9Q0H9S6_9MAGN|nr:hypothetical protein NE237_022495 [Protea cynaroides]